MENLPSNGREFKAPTGDSEETAEDSKESKKDTKKSKSKADLAAEKDSSPEKPPLEKLDKQEKVEIAQDYVQQRGMDVGQELADAANNSPAEAEALANAALLANLQERLDNDQTVDPELLDDVFEETAEDLGLDDQEISQNSDEEVETTEPLDDEQEQPTVPTVSSPPPPNIPIPPVAGPTGPVGPNYFGNLPNTSPNLNLPINPNVASSSERRPNHAKYVLAGGIVGYLIGRRRGRIKTEAKLMPIQEKLEKQVEDLHNQIAQRETKIRQLAAAKAQEVPFQTEMVAKLQVKQEKRQASDQPASPELSPVPSMEKIPKPEAIGKLAVLAERPTTQEQNKKPVDILTAPLQAVLQMAQKIEVNGSNVRQYYEQGRIDQEDLRKVTRAFVAGESYQRLLFEALRPVSADSPEHLKPSGQPSTTSSGQAPPLALPANDFGYLTDVAIDPGALNAQTDKAEGPTKSFGSKLATVRSSLLVSAAIILALLLWLWLA